MKTLLIALLVLTGCLKTRRHTDSNTTGSTDVVTTSVHVVSGPVVLGGSDTLSLAGESSGTLSVVDKPRFEVSDHRILSAEFSQGLILELQSWDSVDVSTQSLSFRMTALPGDALTFLTVATSGDSLVSASNKVLIPVQTQNGNFRWEANSDFFSYNSQSKTANDLVTATIYAESY